MDVEVSVAVAAPRDRVWALLEDLENWPSWTPSVSSVQRLDDGPVHVGTRARVKQPGLPATVWEVTALDQGHELTWQARSPGILTVARHLLSPQPDGGTQVRLVLAQHGPLAGLVSLVMGARTRRYVHTEANGLKAAAESSV